jgi:hypothetical protein
LRDTTSHGTLAHVNLVGVLLARTIFGMPFLDRFWWLRLLLGGMLLSAALLVAFWYLTAIAPIDLGYGPFGVANAILAAETILILIYAGLMYLWRATGVEPAGAAARRAGGQSEHYPPCAAR